MARWITSIFKRRRVVSSPRLGERTKEDPPEQLPVPHTGKGKSDAPPTIIKVHVSLDLFARDDVADVLSPQGLKPEEFDPQYQWKVGSLLPPKGTTLHAECQTIGAKLKRSQVRVTFLYRRRISGKDGPIENPVTRQGHISSWATVRTPTDWIELTHAPKSFYTYMGFDYDNGEPLLARIEPADIRNGWLDYRLVFWGEEKSCPLHFLTDMAQDQNTLNQKIIIGPVSSFEGRRKVDSKRKGESRLQRSLNRFALELPEPPPEPKPTHTYEALPPVKRKRVRRRKGEDAGLLPGEPVPPIEVEVVSVQRIDDDTPTPDDEAPPPNVVELRNRQTG